MAPESAENATCSFCKKDGAQVRNLISGHGAYICYGCVDTCVEIMASHASRVNRPAPSNTPNVPKPAAIKEHLDQYVVGQENAKKALAVALHNHYKRVYAPLEIDERTLHKSNVLLIGPTGTGKTHLVRTLGRLLQVPFVTVDATSFTEAGYIGDDVEQAITALLQNADYSVEKCERGIVYIDEIDKIARKSASQSLGRDVSGEGVQQALLKLMEGAIVHVPKRPSRNAAQQELVAVDTTNILFICGGAFCELEDQIQLRLKVGAMGFAGEASAPVEPGSLLRHTETSDLIHYGLIPEFVGRLPVVTVLDSLDEEHLSRILLEPRGALIGQYQKLLQMDGVELGFTPGAIRAIARRALEKTSGARGLRSILENVLQDVMYQIPSLSSVKHVTISEEVVLTGAQASFQK